MSKWRRYRQRRKRRRAIVHPEVSPEVLVSLIKKGLLEAASLFGFQPSEWEDIDILARDLLEVGLWPEDREAVAVALTDCALLR